VGLNVALFGGCSNKLDLEAVRSYIQRLKWRSVEDIRVFIWGDNDDKLTIVGLLLR
jgi:hypothetical protein